MSQLFNAIYCCWESFYMNSFLTMKQAYFSIKCLLPVSTAP